MSSVEARAHRAAKQSLVSVEEAWERIFAEAAPLPPTNVPIGDADGLALAADVPAPLDLPQFDRSAMDGWAVRAEDLAAAPVALPVDGDAAAGDVEVPPLAPGHARRISTGAELPPGADSILRLEDGEERDGTLTAHVAVRHGLHVRRRGEDVAAGGTLLPAGASLDAASIPLLAASGIAVVPSHRRARVALLTTGSELLQAGQEPRPGAIYDANLPALRLLVLHAGATLVGAEIVGDDLAAIGAAVDRALAAADVLVCTGGISVGPHDHLRPALDERGLRELFWRVRVKPGKPVLAGRIGDRWVLGLPGNPLSTVVGWLLFGVPLIRRLHGHPAAPPPLLSARLTVPAGPSDNRLTLLTARLEPDARGVLQATPTAGQGSHLSGALAASDGFVLASEADGELAAGSVVRVLPVPGRTL